MKILTGPVSLKEALKYATKIEDALAKVANGDLKISKLPLEPLCRLIQFVREEEKKHL